jgi:hypothetical protein
MNNPEDGIRKYPNLGRRISPINLPGKVAQIITTPAG